MPQRVIARADTDKSSKHHYKVTVTRTTGGIQGGEGDPNGEFNADKDKQVLHLAGV